jgi:enterochelin esterase-like enzyme
MKYLQTKILLLLSIFILVGCNDSQTAQAKIQTTSVLPPQANSSDLATPLTYKIESYYSRVMGGTRTYGICLPPGYEHNPQQRYPVIFLLHGGHGSPRDWFDKKGGALTTLQKLYAADKLPPSIVVTPDGNDKRGSSPYWDPEYIDGPNGNVSTAIGAELVKIIQSRYRTLPNPDFWAIGGLSSGGWGAINVGLHHWHNFSILFSHSGYFQDRSGPQNSPIIYIKNISPQAQQKLRIYLDTGKSDVEELKQAREFAKVLNQLKIYHVFRQFPGNHTWSYWREHLADSLTFVGEQLRLKQPPPVADSVVNNPQKH